LRIFQIELAVVCAFEATGEVPLRGLPAEAGAVEKRTGS
jgi:hypothetical protein